jgi:hypothetical protein
MTKPLISSSTRRAAAVLLTSLLIAACSGSAAGTQPAVAGGPSASNAVAGGSSCANPPASAINQVGGAYASDVANAVCGTDTIDPCSMLKQADVQALFAFPLGRSTADHLGNCSWGLADSNNGGGMDVAVSNDNDQHALANDIGLPSPGASGQFAIQPLNGVGDSARWELLGGYFPHVGAIKGQATCELTTSGGDAQLSVKTTGKGDFAMIDPVALPGFIQKFGALCNEIFAGLGA